MRSYLHSHGIEHQLSCPYTPEQNGVAERKHCHLIDTTRTLLHQANLPHQFWVDALQTALYLINRLPSKNLRMASPFHLLYRTPPNYSHLRVFGCLCFPWQKPLSTNKLAPRAPAYIFLGYSDVSKGYRCYHPLTRKVIISRHVIFDEHTFPTIPTVSPVSSNISSIPLLLHVSCSYSQSSTPTITPMPLSTPLPILHNHQDPSPLPTASLNTTEPSNSTPSPSAIPPQLIHQSSLTLPSHPMTTRLKAGITKPKNIFTLHAATDT